MAVPAKARLPEQDAQPLDGVHASGGSGFELGEEKRRERFGFAAVALEKDGALDGVRYDLHCLCRPVQRRHGVAEEGECPVRG